MWMLALLGVLGIGLAERRRQESGQPSFIEPLTQAVQAGEMAQYREGLMEEGALVREAHVGSGLIPLPITLPPIPMSSGIERRHVRAVQAGVR